MNANESAAVARCKKMQQEFEEWAKKHGDLSLGLSGEEDELLARAYRNWTTEVAWRAWANSRNAIAPPVAAGSVESLTEGIDGFLFADGSAFKGILARDAPQIAMQQQEEFNGIMREWAQRVFSAEERAEKAEAARDWNLKESSNWQEKCEIADAELKQVNEWRAAALASNQQLHELMVAKLASAEARVQELEAASAHKQSIIDRLMLEYCPDEMTAEQVKEWAKHQVRAE